MSDQPKQQPHRREDGNRAAEAREARLAVALRANLRRRKTQARERNAEAAADDPKS